MFGIVGTQVHAVACPFQEHGIGEEDQRPAVRAVRHEPGILQLEYRSGGATPAMYGEFGELFFSHILFPQFYFECCSIR